MSPQAPSAIVAHSNAGAAQRRRLIQVSRRPAHSATSASYLPCDLILAKQLNLPHPERLDPWAAVRLDPATDSNRSIFERLGHNSSGLERRHHAPRNSHSKAPCPVPPEIQISRCPGLPHRQNLALDNDKTPYPGQNIVR